MTAELLIDERIATVTWVNPGRANAIGRNLAEAMIIALGQAAERDDIDVIVLRSATGHFCSGWDTADFEEFHVATGADLEHQLSTGRRLLAAIDACPQLTVAGVSGAALGFGTSLLLHCDVVFARPDARFGYVEVGAGVVPTLVAPDAVAALGVRRAKAWLASGLTFDANAAWAAGLATVIAEDLDATLRDFAQRVDGHVARATKRFLSALTALPEQERAAFALARTVENFSDGLRDT